MLFFKFRSFSLYLNVFCQNFQIAKRVGYHGLYKEYPVLLAVVSRGIIK